MYRYRIIQKDVINNPERHFDSWFDAVNFIIEKYGWKLGLRVERWIAKAKEGDIFENKIIVIDYCEED